jgi:DNA polymerase III epsilon subunit family exonuclease
MRYVIADMEATGLGEGRQIIELALLTWDGEKVVDVYETLINPLVPLPDRVQELTGIHPRELERAPKFYEIAEDIAARLDGATFVSHNTGFDWEMLSTAFEAMGLTVKCRTHCTLKTAQFLVPGLKSYTLEALCRFFNVRARPGHRALPDARATLGLFLELQLLAHPPRGKVIERHLPHHLQQLKLLPARAGVVSYRDVNGQLVFAEAADDMHAAAKERLRIRPEAKELLERCEAIEGEVTGSPLIAAFRQARLHPVLEKWMIRLTEESDGWLKFEALPGRKGALWTFADRAEAQRTLRELESSLPNPKFAWREGGRSKEEILEHNRAIDELVRATRFPTDNLLLWGPGRQPDEWSYVWVRGGKLVGWGYDTRPPEKVMESPARAIQRFSGGAEERIAVRYLREHRHKRIKADQWRALKEIRC